jgi:hypothetical protein
MKSYDSQNNADYATWGGSRPGSGPKPTGRKSKPIYVTEEELIAVKAYIKQMRSGKND